jgi:subtilisin family serine protease
MGEGCSYATPLVTGEAALILSRFPLDLPEDVQVRIEDGVVPIDHLPGNAPYEGKLGSGRIYLPAAIGQSTAVPDVAAASIRLVAMPNPTTGPVRLVGSSPLEAFEARVFDAAGRLIRVLERSTAPTWDGMTSDARPVARGVYFIRLTDQDRELVSRVHILR